MPYYSARYRRLYSVAFEGTFAADGMPMTYDSCSYPMFRRMRADVKEQAESIAISMYNGPVDRTYGSDQDRERANLQYVSGWMFDTFGLRPAAGRLLSEKDDVSPGSHPYAVLFYNYWIRRFGRNPNVVGRSFRMENDLYEIVGVVEQGFTGTDTGWATDIFVPMAMKSAQTHASLNNFWLRTLLKLKAGVSPVPVQEKLRATLRAIQEERLKGFPAQSKGDRERFFQEKLVLQPAASGRSNMQRVLHLFETPNTGSAVIAGRQQIALIAAELNRSDRAGVAPQVRLRRPACYSR